jgi:hypothetical protein
MLIDCTLVNDELDLYLARLRHLADHVDRFIVTEARVDYRGRPKPAHLLESGLLDDVELPITHIVLDDLPLAGRRAGEPDAWCRDRFQHDASIGPREALDPDDVLIVADVDEFPSHAACAVLRRGIPDVCTLEMTHCIGSLTTAARRAWVHPYAGPARSITSAFDARYANDRALQLRHAGWHFSYLDLPQTGGRKLATITHEELDRSFLKSDLHLRICNRLGCHPCGTIKVLRDLPVDSLSPALVDDPFLSTFVRAPRTRATRLAAAAYAAAVSVPARQNLRVNHTLDRARELRRAIRSRKARWS